MQLLYNTTEIKRFISELKAQCTASAPDIISILTDFAIRQMQPIAVCRAICECYNLKFKDIKRSCQGNNRKIEFNAKKICCYFLRVICGLQLKEIALLLAISESNALRYSKSALNADNIETLNHIKNSILWHGHKMT
jgi:chromosomal replication initiation ATPase DnaA